jgi:hypothetical protein
MLSKFAMIMLMFWGYNNAYQQIVPPDDLYKSLEFKRVVFSNLIEIPSSLDSINNLNTDCIIVSKDNSSDISSSISKYFNSLKYKNSFIDTVLYYSNQDSEIYSYWGWNNENYNINTFFVVIINDVINILLFISPDGVSVVKDLNNDFLTFLQFSEKINIYYQHPTVLSLVIPEGSLVYHNKKFVKNINIFEVQHQCINEKRWLKSLNTESYLNQLLDKQRFMLDMFYGKYVRNCK